MKIINVSDFTKYPGPRYIELGPNSGEAFRKEVLKPALDENDLVQVNLDNVFGYGSSFLEEAFGGLVRAGVSPTKMKKLLLHLQSNDDPYLIEEITEYVNDALDV
ncbi:STAS-like domain-containing protein [Shewanella oncorhynchi]|uniref:STAS-like domain-containing protein n=1 Tax=Shewanella oncorhynchi TaxID=2726434 RepID=UPI003D78F2AC